MRYPIAVVDPARFGGCKPGMVSGLLDVMEVLRIPECISELASLYQTVFVAHGQSSNSRRTGLRISEHVSGHIQYHENGDEQ